MIQPFLVVKLSKQLFANISAVTLDFYFYFPFPVFQTQMVSWESTSFFPPLTLVPLCLQRCCYNLLKNILFLFFSFVYVLYHCYFYYFIIVINDIGMTIFKIRFFFFKERAHDYNEDSPFAV